ncbi:hypothetical protein T11_12919 [Trichinella zimbabwensis]|uniref:Uncharacterized protein n=1 Tax=Trichinella zimbabwensis TaxID=268475 RepID=A0A0V1GKQ5_9BILA|nr:hypothetical protein T11_12919 [Trichinella zimbabwensis]
MNAVVRDRWDYGDKTDCWRGCWVGEGVKTQEGELGREERREEVFEEYEENKERISYWNRTGKLEK